MISLSPFATLASVPHAAHRSIALRHLRTSENLNLVYWERGRYIPEALRDINFLLRDHRTGETEPIKVRLLDLLFDIQARLGSSRPIDIVSGYRSPKTNAMLRRRNRGVAKNSFHINGMAVDLRIPGYGTKQVAKVARSLNAGGVGYYARSGFVHVDVGPVRTWRG